MMLVLTKRSKVWPSGTFRNYLEIKSTLIRAKTIPLFLFGLSLIAPEVPVSAAMGEYRDILSDDFSQQLIHPLLRRPGDKVISLSLSDCIVRALNHNLDIYIGRYDPSIRMAEVVQAEAVFDAVLFGSAIYDDTDRANIQSGFDIEEIITDDGIKEVKIPTDEFIRTHDNNYAIGLRKQLPTGASIETSQALRRFRDLRNGSDTYNDPFYEYALDITLRQPVLRDFGVDLNRAAINAARNNYRISQLQFQLLVIDTVTEVEANYWQLALNRHLILIFEEMIRLVSENLTRLEDRINYDVRVTIVTRNRSTLKRLEADLVSARTRAMQAQDRLLESINDPDIPLNSDWELLLTDLPITEKYSINRAQAIEVALQMRPEISAQMIQGQTSDLRVGVARNQLLPRLDLLYQQQFSGAGDTSGQGWDQQNRFENLTYRTGISFEIPLGGNRAAQASLRSAINQRHQQNYQIESVRQQVVADVSISVNAADQNYNEIQARKAAVQAEKNTLTSYITQEMANAVITADFLNRKIDSIDRLSNAQRAFATALIAYNIAILNANRSQGILLRYNNIKLAELPAPN
jgi:outer membrane protein TolC